MELTIRLLQNHVLIQEDEAEVSKGGIIIPAQAKEKPLRGIIVSVGPGYKDEPMEVKIGDKVLYGQFAGTPIFIDGIEYLLLRETNILALLTP